MGVLRVPIDGAAPVPLAGRSRLHQKVRLELAPRFGLQPTWRRPEAAVDRSVCGCSLGLRVSQNKFSETPLRREGLLSCNA